MGSCSSQVSALPKALLKPHLPADDGGLAKCEAMLGDVTKEGGGGSGFGVWGYRILRFI